ncbi:hypothetical protein AAHH59_10480 [Pediococcus acidilactici]
MGEKLLLPWSELDTQRLEKVVEHIPTDLLGSVLAWLNASLTGMGL